MNAAEPILVLRDVVIQGALALPRRRGYTSEGRAATPMTNAGQIGMPAGDVQPAAVSLEEEVRRRAYDEGFTQGRAEGRAQGSQEAKQLAAQASEQAAHELDARTERMAHELGQQAQARYQARLQVIDGMIAALPSQVEARLAAAEDDMLALCFEVVCRMLGERAVQPEAIRAQLVHAAQGLRHRKLVAVHLHPDDLAALRQDGNALPDRLGSEDIEWIPSAEVSLGGCLLKSTEGGLDARFETQLLALRELLRQSRSAVQAMGAST